MHNLTNLLSLTINLTLGRYQGNQIIEKLKHILMINFLMHQL